MSILPVLGHRPITSYFSWTSSTKRKRKEVVETETSSTRGISKRPKQSASSSSSKRARLTKEDIADGLKATNRANSGRDKLDSPCTPPGDHSSLNGTLPTPPLTCMAPPRPRKGAGKGLSSSPQRPETPRCQEDEPEDTLPSPPPKDPSASLLVVSNVINVTPTMPELTIPSSQSQDSHPSMEIDILTSFSKFSASSSLLRPTEGDNLIIESSQSQLLVMAPPNVPKLKLEPTLPAFNVIVIPSSQSQEEELTIPTETGARGRYLVRTAQRGFLNPQRTLSDESFSVPIQDSTLDNFFSDEEALDTPTGNNPDSGNPTTLAASETEDEHEGLSNSFYKKRSLETTSQSPAARASSDSQSSLGIGSYSSLPPEVWEFRKMFENGDESYPTDFPESLRS